ncbi:hypothetical protein [Thetidibacter halocola]|uniref:Uncharacterized protein n=1 Tax=Thetidibacter halocola TaxID=2827239 RepID=A0A8J7WE70_9RHOB|nr:hypothetical protein [Thetidibacter halocola]MBS0125977.1 hypothetical protein [Thetidibacter halocola]
MSLPFFRLKDPDRRPIPRGVPRHLPPHLMRDIGLDPWPERPRLPSQGLW